MQALNWSFEVTLVWIGLV